MLQKQRSFPGFNPRARSTILAGKCARDDAENACGDFFGDSRLETVAAKSSTMEDIFSAVANFCGGTPLSDDCTVVDLLYSG